MVDCLKIHIIHLSVIDPVKFTTMQTHHNPINIKKKKKTLFSIVFFHQIVLIIQNIIDINKSINKSFTYLYNQAVFILPAENFFETLLNCPESFALNLHI